MPVADGKTKTAHHDPAAALERCVALAQPDDVGRLRLNFVEMMAMEISEYAVLRRVEEPMGWGGFNPSAGRNSHYYPQRFRCKGRRTRRNQRRRVPNAFLQ